MAPEEAIRLLQTQGTHYSGSDWKYGWPHKFYIGSSKFYSQHFQSRTQCQEWNRVAAPLLGVAFFIDPANNRLMYLACCSGWQSWGVVGYQPPKPGTEEEITRAVSDKLIGHRDIGVQGPTIPEWFAESVRKREEELYGCTPAKSSTQT